jgi:hypothetical protein
VAKNAPTGDNSRKGAVRGRSQFKMPNGKWAERNTDTGRIINVKTSGPKPFKGVRKEK